MLKKLFIALLTLTVVGLPALAGPSSAAPPPPPPEPTPVPNLTVVGTTVELTGTFAVDGQRWKRGTGVVLTVEATCTAGYDAVIAVYFSAYNQPGRGNPQPYLHGETAILAPESFQCTGSPELYSFVIPAGDHSTFGFGEATYFRAWNIELSQWTGETTFCNQSPSCSSFVTGTEFMKILNEIPG